MAYMTQFYSWATGNTITAARLNGNITNIINSLNASGGDKQVNVGSLEVGGVQVIDSSMNLDLGSSNLTLGGLLSIDSDGTALNAAGSLTMGTSNDAGMFFDGTDMVIITDGAGASGIILDSEDDTIEIKGSGVLQATFDTGGLNVVTGDAYSIAGTSVLNAITLGSGVLTSSLTTVGILNNGSITSGFGSIDVGSSNIDGGTITAATALGGTLSTAAQPNITSIGTLTALTINSSTVTFSQDTNFVISGGVNGLSIDGTTFSVDGTNNRIGVGTASPGYKLSVLSGASGATASAAADDFVVEHSASAGMSILSPDDKTQNIAFGVPSDSAFFSMQGDYNAGSPYMRMIFGGVVRVRVEDNGNFGIGITPTAKLHVAGDTIITGDLTVDTNTLFVDSSANMVGIGTSTPSSALEVNGQILISSGSSSAPSYGFTADTGMGFYRISTGRVAYADNGENKIEFLSQGGSGQNFQLKLDDANSVSLPNYTFIRDPNTGMFGGIDSLPDILGFSTAGSERMRIDASGNVGIGAITVSAKLHIDQSSATGAIPVVKLDQGDVSEPFIDFIGTATADANSSISTLTTPGSINGFIQIDKNGSKVWIATYDDPS